MLTELLRRRASAFQTLFGLLTLGAVCSAETTGTPAAEGPRTGVAAGHVRKSRASPTLMLSASPAQVNTGGTATYTITTSRVNRRRAMWINYAVGGTATMGKDYSLSGTSGQTVIRAGATSGNVMLNALPNHLSTGDQVATMILQPGNGYNLSSSNKASVKIVSPKPVPTPTPKLSATPSPTPGYTPAREIWIAVRTDGLPGLGTQANPYDGSTQAKFDALMRSFQGTPNLVINLAAGTFKTNILTRTWAPKSGWVIQGAGMYKTTIQAVGSVAGTCYNIHVLWSPYNVSTDNVVLRDFTVDCNWAELGPSADTGGVVRTITSATTNRGSPTVTASGGAFSATDIGNMISGTGIPSNSFIGVINSPTSVGLSSSPVAYVPVNATATATNVPLTIAQRHIAVDAVLLYGSNNLIERCRHINTFGAVTTNNEEFGFTIAAPSTAQANGNVIRFCRGESPAGHYGSAFNIFGYRSPYSPIRYVTNSEIHDCVAVGTNTGLETGFTNGLGGFADVKNCQWHNNTAIDVKGVFYTDTGSLENVLIANNTVIRGWAGIAMAQGGDPSWTKKNIQIVGNKLNIQNRTVPYGSASFGIVAFGTTASNLTITGNYISFDPTGKGFKHFSPISMSELAGTAISDNVADEASAGNSLELPVRSQIINSSNVTLCTNRTTTGAPMTGLPDNCGQ